MHREHGVDHEKYVEVTNKTDKYLERIYKRYEEPRIPHITNRVWLTDPETPREMTSVL